MSSSLQFDDEMARRVEAIYRTDDAIRRRRIVLEALHLRTGERVLDIGTGPGFVAYEMAHLIGASGQIVAIDASEPMLRLARQRCAEMPHVQFKTGDALRLPVPDESFDVAVSVQVYEYVREVDAALAEMYRVLRPGGRAAIVSTDWKAIAWNATDESRMQRVLSAWTEHCAHADLPRTLRSKLISAGFSVDRHQVIPQFNPIYDPNTYSYPLIEVIRAFVVGRQGLTEAETAEWAEDLRRLGEQGNYFFCLNQYLYLVTK
jgi:ubiquinone/menaquinone biosynthesis C-methylase UbiE